VKTKINKCNPLENLSKRKRKNLVQINLRRKCIESKKKKFKKRKQDRLIQTRLPQLQKLKSRNMLQCQLKFTKKSLLKFQSNQSLFRARRTLKTGRRPLRKNTDLRFKRKRKLFRLHLLFRSSQKLIPNSNKILHYLKYLMVSCLSQTLCRPRLLLRCLLLLVKLLICLNKF